MAYKALSHSVSEWHSDKFDWFEKNADFSTLVAMATSLEKSKKLNEVSKPLTRLPMLKFWLKN